MGVREMPAKKFLALYNSSKGMKRTLKEIALRRDFQKAVVKKLGKDFSSGREELREAFDAVDIDRSGAITPKDVKELLRLLYPKLKDDDPLFSDAFQALNIDGSNAIKWEAFEK